MCYGADDDYYLELMRFDGKNTHHLIMTLSSSTHFRLLQISIRLSQATVLNRTFTKNSTTPNSTTNGRPTRLPLPAPPHASESLARHSPAQMQRTDLFFKTA